LISLSARVPDPPDRRPDRADVGSIRLRGLVLDLNQRLVGFRGRTAELTGRETELLAFLMQNPDRYFSAEDLLRQAWHAEDLSADELRIYVGRLRRKLSPLAPPVRVIGQQWLGYRLSLEPTSRKRRFLSGLSDILLIAYRRAESGLRGGPGERI
jgi:DNA-binding response OmpR family regulator